MQDQDWIVEIPIQQKLMFSLQIMQPIGKNSLNLKLRNIISSQFPNPRQQISPGKDLDGAASPFDSANIIALRINLTSRYIILFIILIRCNINPFNKLFS